MKLKKIVNKGKEGTKNEDKEFVSYQIGKINEFGDGMIVDQPLKGTFTFEPRITKGISYFDKKSNTNKSFDACEGVIQLSNIGDFENVELNEYGSASFRIPGKFIPLIEKESPVQGKTVEIVLRSFEDKDGNKKAVWDMRIDGQGAFKDNDVVSAPSLVSDESLKAFDDEFTKNISDTVDDNPSKFVRAWFANKHTKEYMVVRDYAENRNPSNIKLPEEVVDDGTIPEEELNT